MALRDGLNLAVRHVDTGLLVLRLGVGLGLSFLHGWSKLSGAAGHVFQGREWGFVGAVESLSFPLPVVFALAAALTESLGGLLLALGAFTRGVAALVGFTMIVAIYRHLRAGEGAELAFLYLTAAIALALTGAGRYAIDAWLLKTDRSPAVKAHQAAA